MGRADELMDTIGDNITHSHHLQSYLHGIRKYLKKWLNLSVLL